MKRVHFATMEKRIDSGDTVLVLVGDGYDDKTAAKKGARDLEPGTYYLVVFDSPEPISVAPPPAAVRNVVSFGKPFVERKGSGKPKTESKTKPKPKAEK